MGGRTRSMSRLFNGLLIDSLDQFMMSVDFLHASIDSV